MSTTIEIERAESGIITRATARDGDVTVELPITAFAYSTAARERGEIALTFDGARVKFEELA